MPEMVDPKTLGHVLNSNLISRLRSWWTSFGQPPVLFPVVWLVFYLPRIWRFGFYDGDWVDLMRLNSFESVWHTFNSRPLSIVIFYVLPRLIGDHAEIWQALLSASMLCASFLFYRILVRIGLLLEGPAMMQVGSYRVTADVVVACWLLFPWTLGWTAWPTLMMGQLALLFFLLSMHLLLNAETKWHVVAAAFVYALCDLSYEPFYLAFLPFLAMLFITNERRHFWLMVVVLFSVQIFAIGYNRLMAHIMVDGGAAKIVDFSTVFESLGSVRGLLKALLYSAPQTAKLISNSIVVMVVATGILLFVLGTRFGQKRISLRYSAVLIFAFLMISASVVQFGLAAYGLSGIGIASRTSIAVCVWIAIFIFVFLRTNILLTVPLARRASAFLIALLMTCCALALYHQNELWAFAWRESVRTAMAAPAAEMAKVPANATIVYVGPSEAETMNYINRWSIWVGLPTYHPELRLPAGEGSMTDTGELKPLVVRLTHSPEEQVAIRPVIVKSSYHTLSWDGQELVLASPGFWTEKFRTPLVYEWDAYRGTFRRMEPNAAFGTPPQ
jgi:hypothetical protein